MIWPFSYLPMWMNFLAIWIGYTILLITAYCAMIIGLRWWVENHYHDEIEEWARMRDEARKVRDRING